MTGRSRDRGAAVVEFALVVPLLVLLVVGIMEFGRAYNAQTTASGAARAAARVMALQNDPAAARAAAKSAAAGSLSLTDADIAISPTSCATSGTNPPPTATITVTYTLSFVTGLFGAGLTITGKGVMRCSG